MKKQTKVLVLRYNICIKCKEVKIMTAKQFLDQIWKKDFEINLLQEDIDDLKSKMRSLCSPSMQEKVQVSSENDKFVIFMGRIEKKEQEINEKIDAYIDYREKAVAMINQLPDQEEAAVLYQWYIRRKRPKEIAVQFEKSVSTIWTKYNNALASFEQVHAAVLNLGNLE